MRLQLLFMVVVGVALAGGLGAWELTRIGVHQGYGPEQPIAFPHKVHAGDNKIPVPLLPLWSAHEPSRGHPAGQRVHELP